VILLGSVGELEFASAPARRLLREFFPRVAGGLPEVISWVARGKTNAEIAQILWLAPSTVRKHLENVYAKLGVRTRTAAVATFLGLLDAEASSVTRRRGARGVSASY
jgi:hypothetical protein